MQASHETCSDPLINANENLVIVCLYQKGGGTLAIFMNCGLTSGYHSVTLYCGKSGRWYRPRSGYRHMEKQESEVKWKLQLLLETEMETNAENMTA